MTEKLRPDELQAFKAAFDMFDKNGDGTISTKVAPLMFTRLERLCII
jgi:Ca2+-binding EF-hand superfamily protein